MATKTKTTNTDAPLRGKELLRAVVNKILDHPDKWNQTVWHSCNSAHCVGGWTQIMGGKPEDENNCPEEPKALLGLSDADAAYLFSPRRTISQIHAFAVDFLADKSRFNLYGFNRDGFNRHGFDRAGFNRAGFDLYGFNRDGFNRDGFDRAGFDRAGFDLYGFDRAGKKLPRL